MVEGLGLVASAMGLPSVLQASASTAMEAANATAPTVPVPLVLVGSGLLMAIAFTAGYFIIPRGGVDEVFLVHDSGLLLVHFSKTLRPAKDRDVLVGMLTAVQTFVKDAFSKGPASTLREMDFGDRRLLISKGAYGYLAVVVQGRVPLGMRRRMRRSIEEVEERYRTAIATWDGSTESLTGADDLLIANLLTSWFRQLRKDVAQSLRHIRASLFPPRAVTAGSAAPARTHALLVDPRATAHTLLAREELRDLRAEYRDMMETALQQIEEGRFSLTGLANVYMVMAMQRSPKPAIVAWWNLVLRTVREVLWNWPWTPESQAWVMRPDEGTRPPSPAAEPVDAARSESPQPVAPPIGLPMIAASSRRALRSKPTRHE